MASSYEPQMPLVVGWGSSKSVGVLPIDRRNLIKGSLAFGLLSGTVLGTTKTLSHLNSDGDITAELRNSGPGEVIRIKRGVWTVSEPIKVAAKVIFEGGVIVPATGSVIEFEQDIQTTSPGPLFNLRNVQWSKGLPRSSARKRGSFLWQTYGGIRLPGIAKASWFGALEQPGHDNTLALQAMLDSEARIAVLDGFFEHTANWVASGQTLRGDADLGPGARVGLKTMIHGESFADLLANSAPRSPAEQAFRGLSTHSGAEDIVFSDFEYDGSAREHFDHRDGYRNYLSDTGGKAAGKKSFRRHLLRQGGINIGEMEEDEGYRAPSSTLIERMHIHNTVRSGIVANRAPKVTIRDCRIADSDTDHLIYADRNPDILVQNTHLSGYAHDAMVVISCGMIRDCRVTDLAPNPIDGLDTQSVLWLRSDLDQPTLVERLEITGDLSTLYKGNNPSQIVHVTGERSAYFGDISVTHQGPRFANTTVFGAKFASSRIVIERLTASAMPEGAMLWKSDKKVSDLSIRDITWSFDDEIADAAALMQFGTLSNANFDNFRLINGKVDALVEVRRKARGVNFQDIEGSERINVLLNEEVGFLS